MCGTNTYDMMITLVWCVLNRERFIVVCMYYASRSHVKMTSSTNGLSLIFNHVNCLWNRVGIITQPESVSGIATVGLRAAAAAANSGSSFPSAFRYDQI